MTSTGSGSSPLPPQPDGRSIEEHVARWEEASLLSHEQAEAIRRFERDAQPEPGPRIPLVAELIGYVGVSLVLAAAFVLLGEYFGDLAQPAQLAILGSAALVFLAAGWPLRRHGEPALQRLAALLWTVSIAALAGFLAIAFYGGDDPPESTAPAVGLSAIVAAYAGVMLWLRTSSLLQLAFLVAVVLTVFSGGVALGIWGVDEAGWRRDAQFYFLCATGLALGAAWMVLARMGMIAPRATAYALGALLAGVSPLALPGESVGVSLLVGVAVTGALLGASVWLRSVPALILGAIGLFGYVTGCAVHFLADSAGLPLALLLSGLLLVGIALMTVRLGRIAKDGQA